MSIDNRTKILITVTCATFAGALMGSSINIALPNISHELDINAVMLPWITTAFFLASTVILLPGGRLADIIGPRRIFTAGLIVLMTGSVLCALSNSAMMLIISRAFQGMGNALVATPAAAIVFAAYPQKERGKALGIYLASVYIGLTLGPLIGGVITEHIGWRSIFLLNIPLGLVSLFLLWQLRKVRDTAAGGKFDMIGGVVSGFAILLTIYGLTLIPSIEGICLLIGGLILIAVFVWWEKRAKHPLLSMRLFIHNRTFTFSNMAALINYSATFALSMLISLYIQYIKGFSPQSAGLLMGVLPLVESIFSPISGYLSDRISSRYIATFGMILSTVGLGMLYFISNDTSLWYLILALILIGFGLAFFVSPNSNAIMSSVSSSSYGIASATLATMRQIGAMLSLGIVTVIFATYIGEVEITPTYYPAFLIGTRLAIGIFAVLCFIGIFASYARGSKKNSG